MRKSRPSPTTPIYLCMGLLLLILYMGAFAPDSPDLIEVNLSGGQIFMVLVGVMGIGVVIGQRWPHDR